MSKDYLTKQTVGEYLLKLRKKKDISLKFISDQTKIRKDYIDDLESGKYENFKSDMHLTGIITNYSNLIGADTDKALALLRREQKNQKNKQKKETISKRFEIGFLLRFLTRDKLPLLAGLVIFIAVIAFFLSNVLTTIDDPEMRILSPIEASPNDEIFFETNSDTVSFDVFVEIGSILFINGSRYDNNNLERFTVSDLSLESDLNTFNFTAENEFGKTSQLIVTVEKTSSPTQRQDTGNFMTAKVEVKDRVSAEIIVDGTVQVSKELTGGEELDFEAINSFGINVNDVENIDLYINGEIREEMTSDQLNEWVLIENRVIEKDNSE